MSRAPRPGRLALGDIARLGAVGLRSRPLRVFLSALGIAIGIGAMVAVVGISTSSRAELDRTLDRLGTNLLTVMPGRTVSGEDAKLPAEATAMVGRIGPVESVAATGQVKGYVYRNDHVPIGQTGSISVLAAHQDLPETVGATMYTGSWLTPATRAYPAVVLGSRAATRLDIVTPGVRVWLAGRWFSVVGVLDPVPLAPELDSAALIGWESAQTYAGFDGHPTTVYARATESQVAAVRAVLGATANPRAPNEVAVSRPSDALAAKQATDDALTALLLGLGAVALLVGGVGVANTMVISVLERRTEIGLRRSLGATRGHIRVQFLTESLILAGIGGGGGIVLGVLATGGYALTQGWPTVVPAWATAGGLGATVLIGALAGLYPALRASRMAPAHALAGS
ncbi:ABC transporter permease [Micromonospora tulbaghiae]|uniref:ABC transport system permease protein n=1 Tax=Micromonospora tulbaghiae TaxID=479978 RepID=A0ABY0KH38_9ACTN|nr:ABC transporter permease [Micromonospora tulbaghiae]MDX5456154.1 ABC transporter permease [Micromonospora tulbaghiae]SCE71012.1 putative ABC transport system permease protein [Micromonospora tulbaghiae]